MAARLSRILRPWLLAPALLLAASTSIWGAAAPVIDSLTATPPTIAPGGLVTLSVEAHDPDCPDTCFSGCGQYIRADLTGWTPEAGTILNENDGVSGSPYSATADWQAPAEEGVYTISLYLADSGGFACGGRQSITTAIDVQVTTVTNAPPVVTSLTADPVQLFPGQDSALTCEATDPDEDPVDYTWEAESGTVTPGAAGSATFTAADPGIVQVTCRATDPSGLFGTDSIGLAVRGAVADSTLDSTLVAPQRLAVDSAGGVYVVDGAGNEIRVIHLFSGEPIYALPVPGVRAVAVDWNDNLLVGTSASAWVLTRRGDPLIALNGGGGPGDVSDVAVDPLNMRYGVLHRSSGRVVIYDQAGLEIAAFGSAGDDPDQFKSPQGLAATPTGKWVVGDTGHGQVKIFTVDAGNGTGTLDSAFGGLGAGAGEFVSLDDVAVDSAGVIYVSDAFQDWVLAFNADGTPRESLGGYGGASGEFKTATGIAVADTFDRLLAASANTSAIQIFRTSDDAIPNAPAPILDLSPASLTFGAQALNSSSPAQTLQITNIGTAPLGIRGVTLHRDFVQYNDCGSFVDPGETCSIHVAFRPTVVGQVSGTLVIDTRTGGGPSAVLLSGEGFVAPGVVLDPHRLDYSDQPLGTASDPEPVTLTNTGTVPLIIGSLAVTPQYTQINDCPGSLPGGASCTILVSFEPTTVADSIPGDLIVDSSAPGSPHSIPLDGRGIPGSMIAIDDIVVSEGDGGEVTALFAVSLSLDSAETVEVDFTTAPETAEPGSDYETVSGRLTFPPGETLQYIQVPILSDGVLEPEHETFRIELSGAVNAGFDDDRGQGTIVDDELCPGPNLLVNPSAEEPQSGSGIVGWRQLAGKWRQGEPPPDPVDGQYYFSPVFGGGFNRTEGLAEGYALEGDTRNQQFNESGSAGEIVHSPLASPIAVLRQTVDVSAYSIPIDAGGQRFRFEGWVRSADEVPADATRIVVDYLNEDDTETLASFDSGEITSVSEWHFVQDERTAPEGTRRIRVQLIATQHSDKRNQAIFDALSLFSLRTATLVVEDVVSHEGNDGLTDMVFPVGLSCAVQPEVTLQYETVDGSAVAGQDFLSAAGTLTLLPGQAVGPVTVQLIGDVLEEPNETFQLEAHLVSGEGVLSLDAVGTGTILNDDSPAQTMAYWTNHPEAWPVDRLRIGGVEYDEAELRELMGRIEVDGSTRLAQELVSARFNLVVGSDPAIEPVAKQVDAFLQQHPPGSQLDGPDEELAGYLRSRLEAYNANAD